MRNANASSSEDGYENDSGCSQDHQRFLEYHASVSSESSNEDIIMSDAELQAFLPRRVYRTGESFRLAQQTIIEDIFSDLFVDQFHDINDPHNGINIDKDEKTVWNEDHD